VWKSIDDKREEDFDLPTQFRNCGKMKQRRGHDLLFFAVRALRTSPAHTIDRVTRDLDISAWLVHIEVESSD
jgi:hypothetical protein